MAVQWLGVPGSDLVSDAANIVAGKARPIDIFDFVLATAFPALAAMGIRRLEAGPLLYALLFVLAPLSRVSPQFPLMSFPRFVLLLFPCFVVLACWGERRWFHLTVIFASLLLLLYWSTEFNYGGFVA